MAAPKLSDAVLIESLRLVQQYGDLSRAARAEGMPVATLQSRVRAAHAANLTLDGAERQAIPIGQPFEREWKTWLTHIGAMRDRYAGPAKAKARSGRLKIVAAGDFHIPFHDRQALATLLVKERDADVILVGGDFGDAHCASTFTKYEHVSYEDEHAGKTLVLQQLSETFPIVKYLKGSNHTDRFEKRLRENLSKDVLDAVMSMTGGILNPDLALVKRFPNVEVVNWMTPSRQEVSWLTVIGDVAFCHAEKYSRVAGSALRGLEEWIDDFSGTLGLPKLRAIFQFHTHAACILPYKSDMLLVEPGCMCQVHTYQLGARIAGRPQRLAYATLELVDDKLDVNSVHLHWMHG